MFRGVNSLNLDAKGRLGIPTRYRDGLLRQSDGKMVVTINNADAERCLWLYPLADWEEIERKLVNLPSLDPAAQKLKRILIGHASDCDLDAAGRVLLPALLREFANLDKRVVMIGQGNKFEIWNEQLWNDRRELWLTGETEFGPLTVEMESLSL